MSSHGSHTQTRSHAVSMSSLGIFISAGVMVTFILESRTRSSCPYVREGHEIDVHIIVFPEDVAVLHKWEQRYEIFAKASDSSSQVKLGSVLFIRVDSRVQCLASGHLQLVLGKTRTH